MNRHANRIEATLLRQPAMNGGVMPQYAGLGLANLMPTILQAYGAPLRNQLPLAGEIAANDLLQGAKRIVLLLIDGLGYQQLVRQLATNAGLSLGDHIRDGLIAPITTVAPSTTASALTTLNFGLTPQEHGILGVHLYLREFAIVAHMLRLGPLIGPWSFSDLGFDSGVLFPFETVYHRLAHKRIASHVLVRQPYGDSDLSEQFFRGAQLIPGTNSSDIFVKARKLLEGRPSRKQLIVVYWDLLDTIAHVYGTASAEYAAELSAIDFSLTAELLSRTFRDAVLIITADHGHINTSPEKTVVLNTYHELINHLSIPPTSEPRMPYLHVKDSRAEKVRAFFADHFSRQATVIGKEQAMEAGLFGLNTVYKETPHRLGDLIVLPKKNHTFLYPYLETGDEARLIGMHGGLSPEEMLVPFILLRLG